MEIADFFKIYKTATWEKDAIAMIGLYAENAVIYDMWNKGYLSNDIEWHEAISAWLGSLGDESVKVDFDMVRINQSGNVGFASALIYFQAISSSGVVLRSMKNRITLGFSKFDGGWKAVHQHTSAPINSDSLKAILDI